MWSLEVYGHFWTERLNMIYKNHQANLRFYVLYSGFLGPMRHAWWRHKNGKNFSVTVRGIHRSPVNSRHKGQWRGALMFSWIYPWTNDQVNNRDAGGLRCHRAVYDVTIMGATVFHLGSLQLHWRHMSANHLFNKVLMLNTKNMSKLLPFASEIHRWSVISLTNGQQCGRCSHIMGPSWKTFLSPFVVDSKSSMSTYVTS